MYNEYNIGDVIEVVEDVQILNTSMKGSKFKIVDIKGNELICSNIDGSGSHVRFDKDEVKLYDENSMEINRDLLLDVYNILMANEECHKNRDRMNAFYHMSEQVKLSNITVETQRLRKEIFNILGEK